MIDVHQNGAHNRGAPRVVTRFSSQLSGTRLGDSWFLSSEEKQALEQALSPAKPVRSNVDLIREGAEADSLYILTDGWACRYTTTRNGARHFPALLLPGDIGNLDTLMFDRLDYGVRTLTSGSVATLSRERARALAETYPGIARTFTWLAMVENTILSKWTLSLGRRSAKERLAHLLCEIGARLQTADDAESFALPLTQEHLADALGLTPVHVNRTVRDLRNDGLVVTRSRTITLPDIARLRQVADFDPGYLHLDAPMHAMSA